MMKNFYLALGIVIAGHFTTQTQAQEPPRSTPVTTLLSDYDIQITLTPNTVTLAINAPGDRWFGFGFGAQGMMPGTDVVFFANGAQGAQMYDGHLNGQLPPVADEIQNWTVQSNEVNNDIRTVLMSRPRSTGDPDDFVFDYDAFTLPVIFAYGASATVNLAFHSGNRGMDVLPFQDVLSNGESPVLEDQLSIFPNPASDNLQLQIASGLRLESIRIFDVQAREVWASSQNDNTGLVSVPVHNLAPGLYYLEASSKGDRALVKFAVE
jgi:hypothetical protein